MPALAQLGAAPLIISLPHGGTEFPEDLAARLSDAGRDVADTDWHVHRLYEFAQSLGVSWLQARWSRYVIDLNRPPDDAALYAGQLATGLCPTQSFSGLPLYAGAAPDAAEVAARRAAYWQPYHTRLTELLQQTRARHGYAVLLDAHSIPSRVPRLFPGRLPDINLGSNDGRSCSKDLLAALTRLLAQQGRFSSVLDGRFKGGYITRHYGQPAHGVHALQIELAQCSYMDEATRVYEAERAASLIAQLRAIVELLLGFRP